MMSRAAPWPRESHAALQKRDQSHCESSSVYCSWDDGLSLSDISSGERRVSGDRAKISSASALV